MALDPPAKPLLAAAGHLLQGNGLTIPASWLQPRIVLLDVGAWLLVLLLRLEFQLTCLLLQTCVACAKAWQQLCLEVVGQCQY